MSEEQRKRKGRWARVLLFALVAVGLMVAAVMVVFSLSPVRRGLKAKFDALLVERLGQGAAVEQISAGLKSVVLSGVVLPLDRSGSELRIGTIEFEIAPVNLLRRPEQFERLVRSVRLDKANILIRSQNSTPTSAQDSAWIPKISIPDAVYEEMIRLDSLRTVDMTGVTVQVVDGRKPPQTICTLRGMLARQSGVFQLRAAGYYLADTANILTVTGNAAPHERVLEIQALAAVPPGKLPISEGNTAAISTRGGRISLRLTAANSEVAVRGAASFDSVFVKTPAGEIRTGALRGTLSGDTVALDSVTVTSAFCSGFLRGELLLRNRGTLNLSGEFHADDLAVLKGLSESLPPLEGRANLRIALHGDLSTPVVDAALSGSGLIVYGKEVSGLSIEATWSGEQVEIPQCSFQVEEGVAALNGSIRLAPEPVWNACGQFTFTTVPSLFGWTSAVSELRFNSTGSVRNPNAAISFVAADGKELGTATLRQADTAWVVDLESNGISSGHVEILPGADSVLVTAQNVQRALPVFFPDLQSAAMSLDGLSVRYEGHARQGTLQWDVSVRSDSVSVLSQIARDFHFSGTYDRTDPARVSMEGRWYGTAGDGYPFEGRADLTLENRVLIVDRVFIDAAGELKGQIDLANRELYLELAVTDLDLNRLPIKVVTSAPFNAKGTVSGIVSASGSLDKPQWSADLSMINGSVFGVPGYWLNLSASGEALVMTVRDFEMGRDVRKIVEASGTVNLADRTLAVTAEVGSARAEDFLLALLGKENLLSGELSGRGAISGSLTKPDVEVELSVRNGKLFDELRVDEFSASFRTDENAAGERILKIPRLAFGKTKTYQFEMSADLVPKSEGELHAHIEGKGDFLDLVDQLERSFRTEGSEGTLHMDFGGTIGHPRFLGGELSVQNGLFSYPEATPGLVATNVHFILTPEGVVQSGELSFRNGEQWVNIETIPDCDSTVNGLEPLVIPKPHVCLGVLKIETGPDGMPLHLPGLMKPDWVGTLIFGSAAGSPVTISGYGEQRLLIAGNAELRNSRITFPFVGSGGQAGDAPRRPRPVEAWLLNRLEQAMWNLNVSVGSGDRYDVEITGIKNSSLFGSLRKSAVFGTLADYLDHLSIDAMLEPGSAPLELRGTIEDGSFRLVGRASSFRGKVDYLDQTFNIDHVYADFDETDVTPVLEGRATAYGVDTVGRAIPVYLTLYQIDRETGTRQVRGRLNDMTVVLESDANQTPEQVLQLLGYNTGGDVRGKAEQLVASTFARAIGRQWLNPLTRRLERWTLLDEITISPGGGRGSPLARQQRVRAMQDSVQQTSAVRFFTGSQLTVGKYLTRDVFVTYTGELSEGPVQLRDRLGLIHSWNLEYRINPLSRDLVLDLAVEYDEVQRRRDESVSLKYFFALEP